MLWSPFVSYAFHQANWDAFGTEGAQVTPGINDAKGAWLDLMAGTVTRDIHVIRLHMNTGRVSGQARPILVDIGIDVAGGTTYTVMIPNLNAGNAAPWSTQSWEMGGFIYQFPMFVPAGARLAARAQVGNGTAGFIRVAASLFSVSRPELFSMGTFVDTVGINLANSRGVLITSGNGVKGSWTSLGTVARDAWWFQGSMSHDFNTLVSQTYYVDFALGTAGTKRIIVNNQRFGVTGSTDEQCSGEFIGATVRMPAGTELWARAAASTGGTLTGWNASVMAHVLGG